MLLLLLPYVCAYVPVAAGVCVSGLYVRSLTNGIVVVVVVRRREGRRARTGRASTYLPTYLPTCKLSKLGGGSSARLDPPTDRLRR